MTRTGQGPAQLPAKHTHMPILEPGTILQKRYCIREVIGKGGMGVVYMAEQTIFAGRKVAIKQMARLEDVDEMKRWSTLFLREAQLLGSLSHPGLVEVKDYFEENDTLFLVMEFVEGQSLDTHLRARQEPFAVETVLPWMREVLHVLDYLHSQTPPIIFQDLKPSNLMLSKDGRIRLIDFGIARIQDPKTQTHTLTRGAGTPGYAAPEQHGGNSSPVADIYSAGATMYALLTACVPASSLNLLLGTEELMPISVVNPGVSPALEELIMGGMMALLAANRFQSAADVLRALDEAVAQPRKLLRTVPGSTSATPAARAPAPAPAPRLRRPSNGMSLSNSDSSRLPAPPEPELRVRRKDPIRRTDTPPPSAAPAAPRAAGRPCPGCGTLLAAGQACTRCMPESRPGEVIQPQPAPLPDFAAPIEAAVDDKRPLLGGLFRRDSSSSRAVAGRLYVRREADEQDSPIQVVRVENNTITFNSTGWYSVGGPLTLTLGLARDGSIVSHATATLFLQRLTVTPSQWSYTAEIQPDLKPELARFLKLFEGIPRPERRSETRLPCKIRVTSAELPHYSAMSHDISESGLSILTHGPVEVGQSITLRLDFDDDRFTHVSCKNLVQWCSYGLDHEYRIGTQLQDISGPHASMLSSYLDFLRRQRNRYGT